MGHMRLLGLQEIDHILHVDIAIAQRDVELVEQHHAVIGVADQLFGFFPCASGGGDVAFAVLRVPGKALAHHIDLTDVAKAVLKQLTVRGHPCALDELHQRAGEPVPDAAHDHPEGRAAFTLSGPGVDDDQPLGHGLFRHHLGAGRLDLRHLFGVALVLVWGAVGHLLSLLVAYLVACPAYVLHRPQRQRRAADPIGRAIHHPAGLGVLCERRM